MSEKITIRYKTSDDRIITLSEIDSSPDRASKLSILEIIKLIIEGATFLAIIATLFVYAWLAVLQYTANKLAERNLSDSHAPWVIFHDFDLTVIPEGLKAGFVMENFSESPALDLETSWQNISNKPGVIVNQAPSVSKNTDVCIMPKQHFYGTITSSKISDQDNKNDFSAIMDGSVLIVIATSYKDAFGRPFKSVCSIVHNPVTNTFDVVDMRFIPPKDF